MEQLTLAVELVVELLLVEVLIALEMVDQE